jgi:hypothetical protein
MTNRDDELWEIARSAAHIGLMAPRSDFRHAPVCLRSLFFNSGLFLDREASQLI